MFIRTVFPAPFLPSIPNISPRRTEKETFDKTRFFPNDLPIPSTRRMVSVLFDLEINDARFLNVYFFKSDPQFIPNFYWIDLIKI